MNNWYLERLKKPDIAAPVSGSCASLGARSSPRSRSTERPAPRLWWCCDQTFSKKKKKKRKSKRSLSDAAERGPRWSFLYLRKVRSEWFHRREVCSCARLLPYSSATSSFSLRPLSAGLPPPPLRAGSDLSGHGSLSDRGRSNCEKWLPTQRGSESGRITKQTISKKYSKQQ